MGSIGVHIHGPKVRKAALNAHHAAVIYSTN